MTIPRTLGLVALVALFASADDSFVKRPTLPDLHRPGTSTLRLGRLDFLGKSERAWVYETKGAETLFAAQGPKKPDPAPPSFATEKTIVVLPFGPKEGGEGAAPPVFGEGERWAMVRGPLDEASRKFWAGDWARPTSDVALLSHGPNSVFSSEDAKAKRVSDYLTAVGNVPDAPANSKALLEWTEWALAQDDPFLKQSGAQAASQTVGDFPRETVQSLVKRLNDPKFRQDPQACRLAIDVLGRSPLGQGGVLLNLAKDPQRPLADRFAAIEGLARQSGKAESHLKELMADVSAPKSVQTTAARAFVQSFAKPRELVELSKDPRFSDAVRDVARTAADQASGRPHDPDQVQSILTRIKGPNASLRARAAREGEGLPYDEVSAALIERAKTDPSDSVRRAAIDALAIHGRPDGAQALYELAKDPTASSWVRRSCVLALTRMGQGVVSDKLEKLAKDPAIQQDESIRSLLPPDSK